MPPFPYDDAVVFRHRDVSFIASTLVTPPVPWKFVSKTNGTLQGSEAIRTTISKAFGSALETDPRSRLERTIDERIERYDSDLGVGRFLGGGEGRRSFRRLARRQEIHRDPEKQPATFVRCHQRLLPGRRPG